MNYTVVWIKRAEAKLARIWNASADRREVTRAAHEIDVQLRDDPRDCGESRPDDVRIFFVRPLAVTFRIEEDDRIVRVADVWRIRRP